MVISCEGYEQQRRIQDCVEIFKAQIQGIWKEGQIHEQRREKRWKQPFGSTREAVTLTDKALADQILRVYAF